MRLDLCPLGAVALAAFLAAACGPMEPLPAALPPAPLVPPLER